MPQDPEMVLSHLPDQTTVFILSPTDQTPAVPRYFDDDHDHGADTPIIAHHDFEDGDGVPGMFVAIGPHIRRGEQLMDSEFRFWTLRQRSLRFTESKRRRR